MPVTSGSLTQRLGQMITDIGTFFGTVNTQLATMITLLTEIRTTLRPTTGNPYLLQVFQELQQVRGNSAPSRSSLSNLEDRLQRITELLGSGVDDTLIGYLAYLTQSADGTLYNRNIESLMGKLLDIQGERPDIATLWDLRQALVSPTGPRLQEIVEKLDILLDEKLGVAPNQLTLLELSQLIADCICELNEKTPALPPPDPVGPTLLGHACAEGGTIRFIVNPSSWFTLPSDDTLYATFEAAPGQSSDGYSILAADTVVYGTRNIVFVTPDTPTRLIECLVTTNVLDTCYDFIAIQNLFQQTAEPFQWQVGSITSTTENARNASSGCRPFAFPAEIAGNRGFWVRAELKAGRTVNPDEYIMFYTAPV